MSLVTKENSEVSSVVLVEGRSDKVFIEALIHHLEKNTPVDTPICLSDSCEVLGGKDELEKKLISLSRSVRKEGIVK